MAGQKRSTKRSKGGAGAVTIMPPAAAGGGGPNTEGLSPGGKMHKTTRAVKEMILDALEQAGGVNYLLYQAMVNPQLFMPLVGKVLPVQVGGDPDAPLNVVHHYIQRKSVASPAKKK